LEKFFTRSFSLGLEDMLHKNTFVFENVSLGFGIEFTIKMLIDFFGFSISFQKTTEDTHATNP